MSEGLTIRHTAEEGTVLEGDCRPHHTVVKAAGWRWWRTGGCWYIPRTRGLRAMPDVSGVVAELEAVGFSVEVVDEGRRMSVQEKVAAANERGEARAEALGAGAERLHGRADELYGQARDATAGIPFGQPILVDHYSARRHRAAIDRSNRKMGQSVEASESARELERRAGAAAAGASYRGSLRWCRLRLEEREAEYRRAVREGRPNRAAALEADCADLREMIAEHEAAGVKVWGPADFVKGDRVCVRGDGEVPSATVVRVNSKTLTVLHDSVTWTMPLKYAKVTGKG